MPNWSSRLEVSLPDTSEVITPITSFSTTFATAITPIHSIEADNVGVVKKPQTMTFTMTVPAIGAVAADLYKLAVKGTAFSVQLAESSGADWAFKTLLYRNCFITSANPSSVTVGTTTGALDTTPVATFSGVVLDFAADADIQT